MALTSKARLSMVRVMAPPGLLPISSPTRCVRLRVARPEQGHGPDGERDQRIHVGITDHQGPRQAVDEPYGAGHLALAGDRGGSTKRLKLAVSAQTTNTLRLLWIGSG